MAASLIDATSALSGFSILRGETEAGVVNAAPITLMDGGPLSEKTCRCDGRRSDLAHFSTTCINHDKV